MFNRLAQIQQHMTHCHECDFEYLAYDPYFETHCPECDSKILDDDELYLTQVEDYEDTVKFE